MCKRSTVNIKEVLLTFTDIYYSSQLIVKKHIIPYFTVILTPQSFINPKSRFSVYFLFEYDYTLSTFNEKSAIKQKSKEGNKQRAHTTWLKLGEVGDRRMRFAYTFLLLVIPAAV